MMALTARKGWCGATQASSAEFAPAQSQHREGGISLPPCVYVVSGAAPRMGSNVMMMRSTAIGFAALLFLALVSTDALAGHGGGGGGHWGGGGAHWSGGGAHWAGGGARWAGGRWAGGGWGWHGRRVAFFHGRRFFGGPFFVGVASADFGCWRWAPTPWGWRRAWVCGNPDYGYF